MSAKELSHHPSLELEPTNVNVTIATSPSREELPPLSKISMGPYADINKEAEKSSVNGGLK